MAWPAGRKPEPSDVKIGWLGFVPYLGFVHWRRLIQPVLSRLDAQLTARAPSWEGWRIEGAQLQFVRLLSQSIAAEMGWPSEYFIPNDPLDIVLFPHSGGDGGELIHALYQVEKTLGVRLDRTFIRNLPSETTYGEFAERCWNAVEDSRLRKDSVADNGTRRDSLRKP